MGQDQPGEVLAEVLDHLGVGDGCFDLGPVPYDPGLVHQPIDVGWAEAGHPLGLEAGEGVPEGLPFAQDGDSDQSGLDGLQAQPLVQNAHAGDRPVPLVVVIVAVLRSSERPAAAKPSVAPNCQHHTGSQTAAHLFRLI